MRNYRGLTKDGKWVYGYHCKVGDTSYIFEEDDIEIYIYASLKIFASEVISETVGQSTGLKDKNKNEIYSEDVIQIENYEGGKTNWLVEWCDLGWRRTELPWDSENEPANRYELCEPYGKCEIIGDIYTHPELMEQDNA